MNTNPVITIGMPVYNDVRFLSQALDSLLSQSFTDFKIIISDDASTDGSDAICKFYQKKDSRVIYVRQPENIGISRNMEFLLGASESEYFCWAANDDVWGEDFLLILKKALDNNPESIVAFSKYCYINEDGGRIKNKLPKNSNYSGRVSIVRILKLIYYFDDGCGYGLMRRKSIQNVNFPKWWWKNKKISYNNIYPSLFYYLSRGDFSFVETNDFLWMNRLKDPENINHSLDNAKGMLMRVFLFSLRKINLFYECVRLTYTGPFSILNIMIYSPFFFARIVIEIIRELGLSFKLFFLGKIDFF